MALNWECSEGGRGAAHAIAARLGQQRWSRKAALPLVFAALLLAAGCTSSAPGGPNRLSQLSAPAVYLFLPATGAQLTAGTNFQGAENRLRNEIAFRCMSGYGFGPKEQPIVTYFEKYINPPQGSPMVPGFAGLNWSSVPNLYDIPRLAHGGLLAEVRTGSPNPVVPPSEFRAIAADYQRCEYRSWLPFRSFTRDGRVLGALWGGKATAVEASASVQAAYHAFGLCVRKRGAPPNAAVSPDGYRSWLTLLVAPPMPDPYGETALIASELKLDRRWTAVFARCLGPVLQVQDPLLLKAQATFLQDHYQQVLAMERLAVRAVSRLDGQYHMSAASS